MRWPTLHELLEAQAPDLPGHGDTYQRLEHELRVLFEPPEETADVGLCGAERHSADSDSPIQRMSDRAVRGHDEVSAHLGLAPHHHPDGIPGSQRYLVRGGCRRLRLDHHRLVAGMKTVEIAERDDAAAKRGRNRRAPVEALHGASIGAARRDA
jgi:hypothetical protein